MVFMLSSTFAIGQSPGSLDLSFGTAGIATVGVSGFDQGYGVNIQSNGNILMSGYTWPGTDFDFSLVSLEPDGSLDIPFGTGARVTTDLGGTFDVINEAIIDSLDRIVVAGVASFNINSEMAIARYLSDGSLDMSFGTNGIYVDDLAFSNPYVQAVDLDANGNIVVVGATNGGFNTDLMVARLLTDGSLDASFSSDGYLTLDLGAMSNWGNDVKVLSDGKILIAGTTTDGIDGQFVLHRFFRDGTPDAGFGTNGTALHSIGNGDAVASAMGIQSDGKIVLVGFQFTGIDDDMVAMRLNANGSVDPTFNGTGFNMVDGGSGYDRLTDVVILPNGKIAATGIAANGTLEDLVVVMFESDGTLDNTFGSGGVVTITSSGENNLGYAITMDPTGDLIAVGSRDDNSGSFFSYLAVRLLTGLNIGIADFSEASAQMLVYPNPIQDAFTLNFTLETAEQIDLKLLDTQGRLVHTFQAPMSFAAGEQQLSFNLPSNLASGSYHLVLSNQHGTQQIQIIH